MTLNKNKLYSTEDVQDNCEKLGFCLKKTAGRLVLHDLKGDFKPFYIDFLSGKLSYRQKQIAYKNELIARAAAVKSNKKLSVIDATAGLGRDAFILANLGCHVTMLERSPIIAALLDDALQRLYQASKHMFKNSLRLIHADSLVYLSELDKHFPDIIYLDPMFPSSHQFALVKKESRILKALVGTDLDADSLLAIALTKARKRVMVKRPIHALPLAGKKPDIIYEGKKIRFDVYNNLM